MINYQNINLEISKYQIMVIGDNLDGKSSVIKGLLRQKEFSQSAFQLPFQNLPKELTVNKKKVNLHLWDINTNFQLQEHFSLIKQTIQLQQGFILVFDVNNEESLRNLTKWYRIILETTLLEDINPKIYLLSTDCYHYNNGYKTLSKRDIDEWIEDNEVTKYIEIQRDIIYNMNYPYFKKLLTSILNHISIYGEN
ncbi:Gtr1/RagA G motif protein (macronuclear) [Tetrahymena thermophila SB210]|uniref:Gtr1/RagA G motif protein n=1 Tax=Tetrahymena thermophila (strain SB210) TaxID=312017 RepID=Q239J9_TETTS|nr:Gtr1/RagA G motif protein [Tetrahymena thermophila SB210]EAR93191.1 Gtr1/RagA G motif protein [Tetrahymena thermophila SB210]|eukprot:XP_001013436.1 Gtr1/RagA G motif protein [Tetrahymena thermophila SB210]